MRIRSFLSLVFMIIILPCLPVQAKELQIAVLIKGLSNPYWKALSEGADDAAKASGVSLQLQGAQTDQEIEAQLNMCQTMLLKKPDALIFATVNQVNLLPCLKQAQQKNIPLIDVDGSYTKDEATKYGVKVAFSVASNNYELGKKAAQYLQGKTGKVLVIEGLPGNSPGELRLKGFRENLPKGLQIVASLPGDWDRLKAADITNDILTKTPDLKIIFAANDTMALGVAETVHSHKRDDIVIVGIDGTGDAVKAIKAGRLTASVAQLPYLMGKQAVEKVVGLLKSNKHYDYAQYVPIVLLDKRSLNDKNNALLGNLR
jgi:D-allose transport system substrate-binding protein